MKRIMIFMMALGLTMVFSTVPVVADDSQALRAKEKEYLKTVIDNMGGDKVKAAKELDISLATLYRKLPEVKDED